ncbi:hypothetical protein CU097_015215 [Rhizopus azygosporus]|uniref:Uncharacterized protein n=1 Tax=Rhizopus azygosporus TaxID=86630 RepID=A0A367KA98_RHIAZ|nr:hypothetical protein CU097_015215 [Rhizopus azygosporus]
MFRLTGLDPGRNTVFTAAYGDDNGAYQVRRCTRKEYNTYSGSRRIAKEVDKRAEQERITEVLHNKPTEKTASTEQYSVHINYVLSNLSKYLEFYKSDTARTRFYLYQGRQRALEEMTNILVNGGKEYNHAKRKNT